MELLACSRPPSSCAAWFRGLTTSDKTYVAQLDLSSARTDRNIARLQNLLICVYNVAAVKRTKDA